MFKLRILVLAFAVTALSLLRAAPAGFLFVTFKGEQTPMSEQVYFALSQDGRNWRALNKSAPVLVSQIGEKGVRDPYVLRAHGEEKFYLIATDLSINLNPEWRRAAQAGSRSIMIWESTDLVKWSEPRLVEIAAKDAGCTWAPEAAYDEETGDYLVFWASTNKRDNFAKFRIWAARTRDFKTFGEPFVYIDRPHAVIDTTIVHDGNRYYRFTKDENKRAIFLETGEKLVGEWREVAGFTLANLIGYEGPQCYLVEPGADGRPPVWGLILDHYTKGAGYQPFVTHDLASGNFEPGKGFTFPFRFRHGSVLTLTAEEYRRLDNAYGSSRD